MYVECLLLETLVQLNNRKVFTTTLLAFLVDEGQRIVVDSRVSGDSHLVPLGSVPPLRPCRRSSGHKEVAGTFLSPTLRPQSVQIVLRGKVFDVLKDWK